LSDDIEFMIDFGESKKLKQLAEIITGLVGIMLNAVGLLEDRINQLEDRINQLDNGIKAFERKMSTLESRASAPSSLSLAPSLQSPERDYAPEQDIRSAPTVTARTPTMAPVVDKPASTSRTPPSPASARMQLQSELKELFSRLRRSE